MEFVKPILINFVVPSAGIVLFLELRQKMLAANVEEPPSKALFVLFATYGGWLVVILTSLFGYWSGMATLGFAYLMLFAPLLMPAIAIAFFGRRVLSVYHRAVFWLSAAYVPWLILLGLAYSRLYGNLFG